jgi:transcriptional regulator of acetoin/glycerol metabolism
MALNAVWAAFESLGKVVAVLDESLRVIDASPGFRGLLARPDVEGLRLQDVVGVSDLEQPLRAGKRCTCRADVMFGRNRSSVYVSAAPLVDKALGNEARYLLTFDINGSGSHEDAPEAQRIRRALEENRWRRTAAARTLGISRATLWRRMRHFGML